LWALTRLLIHAGGFNLGLVMRQVIGVGTPWAAGASGDPDRHVIHGHWWHPTTTYRAASITIILGHPGTTHDSYLTRCPLVGNGDFCHGLLMLVHNPRRIPGTMVVDIAGFCT
jgi:hypothetical protein